MLPRKLYGHSTARVDSTVLSRHEHSARADFVRRRSGCWGTPPLAVLSSTDACQATTEIGVVQIEVTHFGLAKAGGGKPRMGRPIASNASVCPPAKHVRIGTGMQAFFPAISAVLAVFDWFLGVGHHRVRWLPTCIRLKKMQAIACVKIGCPGPKMAVLSPSFYPFFCHLRNPKGSVKTANRPNPSPLAGTARLHTVLTVPTRTCYKLRSRSVVVTQKQS